MTQKGKIRNIIPASLRNGWDKRKKIATFQSNQPYSLKSGEVVATISKADYFCEIINQAKEAGKN